MVDPPNWLNRDVGPAPTPEPSEKRDEPMMAMLRASRKVRDGRWLKGAPTHVLAEFLTALENDGWRLVTRSEQTETRIEVLERALRNLTDAADSLTVSLPTTDTQANIVRNLTTEARAAVKGESAS